jgi:hypothetical protein
MLIEAKTIEKYISRVIAQVNCGIGWVDSRHGNVSYRQNTLYSYALPIAHYTGKKWLIHGVSNSFTTNRHIGMVARAIGEHNCIYVDNVVAAIEAANEKDIKKTLDWFDSCIAEAQEKARKARARKKDHERRVAYLDTQKRAYIDYCTDSIESKKAKTKMLQSMSL